MNTILIILASVNLGIAVINLVSQSGNRIAWFSAVFWLGCSCYAGYLKLYINPVRAAPLYQSDTAPVEKEEAMSSEVKLYAMKTQYGYYIVDEHGRAVHPDGSPAYHPYPCEKGDYPEYKPK